MRKNLFSSSLSIAAFSLLALGLSACSDFRQAIGTENPRQMNLRLLFARLYPCRLISGRAHRPIMPARVLRLRL